MPRRKRKPLSRRTRQPFLLEEPGPDTSMQIMVLMDCLMNGDQCFATMLDDDNGFKSEEEERRTWKLNKELLLSLQSEDPSRDGYFCYLVGNRPWGWWKHESGAGAEIWNDFSRFTYGWQRWQYDWLKERDLISPEEEEKVRRLCARVLAWNEYSLEESHLTEWDLELRRKKRKPFELD